VQKPLHLVPSGSFRRKEAKEALSTAVATKMVQMNQSDQQSDQAKMNQSDQPDWNHGMKRSFLVGKGLYRGAIRLHIHRPNYDILKWCSLE
jgi:hypothetical protein